jgi:tetratricopeptide (TPR) repeat protein
MAGATPREKAYIAAMVDSYMSERGTPLDRDRMFAKEMKKVSEQYPDDLDAATISANFEFTTTPPNQLEGVKQVFRQVLEKDPKHPGANHYLIHLIENTSSDPKEALASAKTLEHLIPFAGHLLHMPGHIYYILGRYADTEAVNKRAIQADEEFFAKGGFRGDYFAGYYLHNYQFLIAALVMEGKEQEALQVAQRLNAIIETSRPRLSIYMTNELSAQRLLILYRFERWDQILKEPMPGTPLGNGIWHFSRSMAYLAFNDLNQAKVEASAIQNEQVDRSEDSLNTFLKILFLNARAAIEEREGNREKMFTDYHEAIQLEDPLFNIGPPVWFNSSREALAYAYLRAGNRVEAEKLFRKDLEKHPNKSWSLKGLRR